MEKQTSASVEDLKQTILSGIREQWAMPELQESEVKYVRTLSYNWRSRVMLASLTTQSIRNQSYVVVKTFNDNLISEVINNDERRNRLVLYSKRETGIWRKVVHHPNVAGILGIMENFNGSTLPATVFPYYPRQDLRCFVDENPNVRTKIRISLMRDVGCGLDYLHTLKPQVIHRDIKGSNILVKEENGSLGALLTDFGSAKFLDRTGLDTTSTSTRASLQWTPPEYIKGDQLCYNDATSHGDIWSFGCMLLEILQNGDPWGAGTEVFLCLQAGGHPPQPALSVVDESLWSLMEMCWKLKPENRIDADAIVMYMKKLLY